MTDLWPKDLMSEGVGESPGKILREQAALLGKKTNNIVEGFVKGRHMADNRDIFVDNFYIKGPLINYTYKLFSIEYSIMKLYPVKFIFENELYKEIQDRLFMENKSSAKSLHLFQKQTIEIQSENEFIKVLKYIFNASKTKELITSIKSQSELF